MSDFTQIPPTVQYPIYYALVQSSCSDTDYDRTSKIQLGNSEDEALQNAKLITDLCKLFKQDAVSSYKIRTNYVNTRKFGNNFQADCKFSTMLFLEILQVFKLNNEKISEHLQTFFNNYQYLLLKTKEDYDDLNFDEIHIDTSLLLKSLDEILNLKFVDELDLINRYSTKLLDTREFISISFEKCLGVEHLQFNY